MAGKETQEELRQQRISEIAEGICLGMAAYSKITGQGNQSTNKKVTPASTKKNGA